MRRPRQSRRSIGAVVSGWPLWLGPARRRSPAGDARRATGARRAAVRDSSPGDGGPPWRKPVSAGCSTGRLSRRSPTACRGRPRNGRPGSCPSGFDTATIDEFLTWALAPPEGESCCIDAIVAVQGGELDARALPRRMGSRRTAHLSWSMAKSITQAMLGILVAEGRLDVFAPAEVPEWADPERSPPSPSRSTTLLHMRSGLEWVEEYEGTSDVIEMLFGEGSADRAHFAADRPLEAAPRGAVWNYSTGTSMILSRIIADQVGYFERGHAVGAGRAVRSARDHLGRPRPRRHRRDERRVGDRHDGPRLRPLRAAVPAWRRVGRHADRPRGMGRLRADAARRMLPSTAPTGGWSAAARVSIPTSFAGQRVQRSVDHHRARARPRRRRPRQRGGCTP